MYKDHPVFNPPPSDATLWRYLSFTKFVSLLEKKALFFARADKLGDPFEGALTEANIDMIRKQDHNMSEKDRLAYLNFLRESCQDILISCWHENADESAAMWKLYSKEHDGIAIKTNFTSFKQSFIDEQDIFIGRVSYVDYQNHIIPQGNIFYPYLHKRKSFKHENEVRAIVLFSQPNKNRTDLSQDISDVGEYYKVNISSLVQEVVVAPYAPNWFLELVVSVSKRYGLSTPVNKSVLGDEPTWS